MPTVSIIIPCYNAEAWIAEAVQSCLDQAYDDLEIIVIDDGSSDGSHRILESFGNSIKLRSVPNRGGNVARNEGTRLSTGDYIQFLDADDYLLPDKIARQVRFLEETGADVVYGDWRYRFHLSDGFSYLDRIAVSGVQDDVLESLMSGWWVAPGAILYRRGIVEEVGGWDEKFQAGQDRDFITSIAITDADIRYLPGCDFIYRKYGEVTISTSNIPRWFDNHCRSLEKSELALQENGRLSQKYKDALATGYSRMLQFCLPIATARHFEVMARIGALVPGFRAEYESGPFRLVQRLFGYRRTAQWFSWIRAGIATFKLALKKTFILNVVFFLRRLRIKYFAGGTGRVVMTAKDISSPAPSHPSN